MSINDHSIRQIIVQLARVENVSISSCSFGACQLNCESRQSFGMILILSKVEQDRPVIDIGVIRLWTNKVAEATKYTPVDIIQVFDFCTLSHCVNNTVWKICWKVVYSIIVSILLWMESFVEIWLVSVLIFARAFIWSANSPDLHASIFLSPARMSSYNYFCCDDNVVFNVVAKDSFSVNSCNDLMSAFVKLRFE